MACLMQSFCFQCTTPERYTKILESRLELTSKTYTQSTLWNYIDTADKALNRNNIILLSFEFEDQTQLIYIDKNDSAVITIQNQSDPWIFSTENLPPKLSKRIILICAGHKLVKLHRAEAITTHFSYHTYTGMEIVLLWFLQLKESNLAAVLIVGKRGYRKQLCKFARKITEISSEQLYELKRVKPANLLQTNRAQFKYANTDSVKLNIGSGGPVPSISVPLLNLLKDANWYAHWIPLQIDPEFLHQFRTTLRKSLAILNYFAPTADVHESETFESEVKYLLHVSSKARDLDVFRDTLDNLQTQEHKMADLTHLIELCELRLSANYLQITREINSPRFEALVSEWKRLAARTRTPLPRGIDPVRLHIFNEQPVSLNVGSNDIYSNESSLPDSITILIELLFRYHSRAIVLLKNKASDAKLHSVRKHLRDVKYIFETMQINKNSARFRDFYQEISTTTRELGQIHDLKIQIELLNEIQAELNTKDPNIAMLSTHLKKTRKRLMNQTYKRVQSISSS